MRTSWWARSRQYSASPPCTVSPVRPPSTRLIGSPRTRSPRLHPLTLGEEPAQSRMQVGGGIGEGEFLHLSFARRRARARPDKGDRLLVFQFVVDRHHHGLMDVGVALQ